MLKNKEGEKVPNVTFKIRNEGKWEDLTTDKIFKGKNIVLFALPGAFTPTCSSTHVPGYNDLATKFKENGIDEIVCLSVNDTFVMNEWQKDQAADNITFLPDGNGEFSEGMGLLVDKNNLGFGKRSWRYSMLVKDCKIEKMFIEPEVEGDPFEVSDAETMLKHINPKSQMPKKITLFTKVGCPYCAKAKSMLKDRGLNYEEIIVGKDTTVKSLFAVTGAKTVPQVFVDGKRIGGSEDLEEYLKKELVAS